VYVYDDPSSKTLNVDEIVAYLGNHLPLVSIQKRGEFLQHHFRGDVKALAESIACTKVRSVSADFEEFDPLPGEIRFEENLLESPERRISGILYDAPRLQLLMRDLVPANELNLGMVHVVFTPRLFGTFDAGDRRYHARVILCGYPNLISTSGIVEAPAKPREFYLARQAMRTMGTDVPAEVLEEKIEGRFLDYDDPRLTDVVKGYVMQAMLYSVVRELFCDDARCRLYNAHWQEEVLEAQLGEREFCDRHASMIREIARS
jgi:hypothetical protein